jgi:EAL domain-containing protein (putative c-di-GMP-specific phosphodiesterase class I)/GGDEF domain-containing protein
MSLHKQLWIAIAIMMGIALTGSFLISSLTVKNNVEYQLRIKNIDNANSLALAATQVATDQTMAELIVSAQFDNGHYQYIRLISPDGELILERTNDSIGGSAPEWFKNSIDIVAPDGVAEIQAGWQQLASLRLQSDAAFAYQALWNNTLRLILYFIAALILCGLLGHAILTRVTKPLHSVVQQAQALRQRRFTKVALPYTLEFKDLVQSMNDLSEDVKKFFKKEAQQLQKIQQDSRVDPISGTLSREHFFKSLNAVLRDEQNEGAGTLALFRIDDLHNLNRLQRRSVSDLMLKQIGKILNGICGANEGWLAGRLNGADFIVLSPSSQMPVNVAIDIHKVLLGKLKELGLDGVVHLPAAVCHYSVGENLSHLLSRLDQALAVAEQRGGSSLEVAEANFTPNEQEPVKYWGDILQVVLQKMEIGINYRPLIAKSNQLIFSLASGEYRSAGKLISSRTLNTWAARLGRSYELDCLVIDSLVTGRSAHAGNISVTLSVQSLADSNNFDLIFEKLLSLDPKTSSVKIPEHFAQQNFTQFRHVCKKLRDSGYEIGLSHVGHHVENIGLVYDCGISYVVLDSALVFDIEASEHNQILVRSLATIFHSIGTRVYADDIKTEPQWGCLLNLGVDGGCGAYAYILQQLS